MALHIPSKTELISKLDNLRDQTKTQYVIFGKKLLASVLNPINKFARHLIVLQGKNPDPIFPVSKQELTRAISDIRPSFNFGGSSRGWDQSYFKNPEKHHPILVGRIKTDKDGVLKVSKESDYMASALQVAEVAEATEKMENYEASRVLELMEASLGVPLPQLEVSSEEVNIVSGSRSVSKKKVSKKKVAPAKKAAPKKKAVTVRRFKKGVFRRVED